MYAARDENGKVHLFRGKPQWDRKERCFTTNPRGSNRVGGIGLPEWEDDKIIQIRETFPVEVDISPAD